MKIPIVNEQDEIIAYKDREETTREDIRRITSLWLFNSKGEFLIARRQATKKLDPNKWGPAVAGTVEEGETYDSNIVKEVQEEIGLTNIELRLYKKYFYETENSRRFNSLYIGHSDTEEKDFVIQDEEVSAVKWISIKDLEDWFSKSPEDFVPSFGNAIVRLKEYETQNQKT